MNWYKGNIAEAVAMSKTKNAIFVVYIEGKDELTQKLTNIINETKIKTKLESDDFVAIKIESDSQAYLQFAKIYQVVPVPSIFFIGNAGTPLDIGTGIINTSEELEQKIEKVLVESGKYGNSAASSSSSLISAEQQSAIVRPEIPTTSATVPKTNSETHEVVCEDDICQKVPKAMKASEEVRTTEEPSKSPETTTGGTDANAQVEETRKLLEQKRRERIEAEKQMEKEEELRRRREGKDMQQSQSWQKDQELKELKENIRRERLEEQATRERIRAQIAGDRAERAEKTAVEQAKANVAAPKATVSSPQASRNTDSVRLQFRLSTGTNKTETFNCQDTLNIVRLFVQSELIPGTGIRNFILATNYPKREFTEEDDTRTLVELGLFPSAVILVIAKESRANPSRIIARSGGILNIMTTLFWAMLSPVFAVYGYIRNIAVQKDAAADGAAANSGAHKRSNDEQLAQQDAAKRRNLDRFANGPSTSAESSSPDNDNTTEAKPYRRYVGGSNIHRLTDKRKDSDDENATWNGNSTQQQ